jgi:hypothetical protein
MEKVCRNCEHFALMCLDTETYVWGICHKPETGIEKMSNKKEVIFKWAEDTCSDFKPKKGAKSRHLQKWLKPLKKVLRIS